MYLISGHYRQPLAFSQAELEDAERSVRRIRETLRHVRPGPSPPELAHHKDAFFDALANDFNTPAARDALFKWLREANSLAGEVGDADLREMLGVLGFEKLAPWGGTGELDPEAVDLLARRELARARRDFSEADRLRAELLARGYEIRDGPQGSELIPAQRG